MLKSSTHPRWFYVATRSLPSLLSDHLHCERKAAENALSLIRRYPTDRDVVEALGRLAHEETSHVVQVAALIAERGLSPRSDVANQYARALLAEVRPREPEHRLDALLCAALIEARSHERLQILERGFAAAGDQRLAAFYRALASAEDRHAETFLALAERAATPAAAQARREELAMREAEILAALPFCARIH